MSLESHVVFCQIKQPNIWLSDACEETAQFPQRYQVIFKSWNLNVFSKDRLKGNLDNIETQISQSKVNIDTSVGLLANASDLLELTSRKLEELEKIPDELDRKKDDFKTR